MFYFDGGLKLKKAQLAVDFCRRQPRAFISHAHTDHMARHEFALCTPATAELYQFRYGRREVRHLPYRTPVEWGGLQLTTFPAGHCFGSAMLLAEDGEQSLLYTGDFKLSASATAERAELPQADILVIESTFGNPRYRLPPRDTVVAELIERVQRVIASGKAAVIQAYVLGKGQEVTKLLTQAGIPVVQHPRVHEISQVYQACGMDLGEYTRFEGQPLAGTAYIVPPGKHRGGHLPHGTPMETFAVTGWAHDAAGRYRLAVDHALPLSDHADYDELFEAVQRVQPREIYCTHGPADFADRLREAGHNAYRLGQVAQLRLF